MQFVEFVVGCVECFGGEVVVVVELLVWCFFEYQHVVDVLVRGACGVECGVVGVDDDDVVVDVCYVWFCLVLMSLVILLIVFRFYMWFVRLVVVVVLIVVFVSLLYLLWSLWLVSGRFGLFWCVGCFVWSTSLVVVVSAMWVPCWFGKLVVRFLVVRVWICVVRSCSMGFVSRLGVNVVSWIELSLSVAVTQ